MMTLEKRLTLEEGLKLKPYFDTQGKETIGVGRNLTDKGLPWAERKKLGIADNFRETGITQEQAYNMLKNDIADCRTQLILNLSFFGDLDKARQDVLIDMCFNLGIRGLLGFKKTLSYIADKKYDKAADEMLSSKWFRQVHKRALSLADTMRTGVYVERR